MRCLYCGKQLALLRRLTGGGEFCSEAHKQSYQEEYNRLALSRLLQAQSKPGEIKAHARTPTPEEGLGAPLPPGASRHRALPEGSPPPEPPPVRQLPEPAAYEPEVRQEAVQEVEQPVVQQPVEEEAPSVVEEPVPEMAGFSFEQPSWAWLAPESAPYLETYTEAAVAAPAVPAWLAASESYTLSLAPLASLGMGGSAAQADLPLPVSDIVPREFARVTVDLSALSHLAFVGCEPADSVSDADGEHPFSLLPTAELARLPLGSSAATLPAPPAADLPASPVEFTRGGVNRNVKDTLSAAPLRAFPSALPIPFDVRIAVSQATHPASLNGTLGLPVGISFEGSPLLSLCPAEIDFPAEDAEVVLVAAWADSLFSEAAAESSGATEVAVMEPEPTVAVMEPESTPRQALEALSRLHQDLVQEQETPQIPVEPVVARVEVVEAPLEVPPAVEAAPVETAAATLDVAAEQVEERPIPPAAHDLFPIAAKTFAPPKPAILVESQALVNLVPDVPPLKSLPLRPKVAKAPPGFSPEPTSSPAQKPAIDAKAKTPPRGSEVKPAPLAKQPVPPVKSAPAAQPAKPGQSAKPAPPVKPAPPAKSAQIAKPSPEAETKPDLPAAPLSSEPVTARSERPSPASAEAKPPAPPETAKEAKKPDTSKPEASTSNEEVMPSFASIQPGKAGAFPASMRLVLIIAIVLAAIAGGAYFVWSGKPHRSAIPASAAVPDVVVGPSIMMGEGGWVPGWGGDVNGSRAGRQITIYRPSLKLSDYRIEFQGSIELKSMGWVFRALDPYNYYAAKLAMVSSGPSPKLALIKYSIEQGHETEVGRVPLSIAASSDTLFSVRMDVHGSTFRTYIQGQAVDVWTDDRLKTGGVGFFNERAERARIKSSSIYYLTGGKN